ncbi:hypothetical protein MIR68_005831 [Amoeboaphelidium protococcarum]|nr:hypothetical protein MIR68_005831 [Amoeboaphelidium protococcarum]
MTRREGQGGPSPNICCGNGYLTQIPLWPQLPPYLTDLLEGNDARSRNFRTYIRGYNSVLSFGSFVANINKRYLNRADNNGIYAFQVQGAIYVTMPNIGGDYGRNADAYLLDPQFAMANRLLNDEILDREIVLNLAQIIEQISPLARQYVTIKEQNLLQQYDAIGLRLIPTADYNQRLPEVHEIAMILPGDIYADQRDVNVIANVRNPQDPDDDRTFVSMMNPAFDSIAMTLVFPGHPQGYHPGIRINGESVSPMDFYRYHFMFRQETSAYFRMCALFHQNLLIQYMKVLTQRLDFLRFHQNDIGAEVYRGRDYHGQAIILPASHTGSPRYMSEKYADCVAIGTVFGKPTFFQTVTANPNWPDIQNALLRGQTANDRPDKVCRVFKLYLDEIMDDIKKNQVFGEVLALTYTVEWQKRGLPHAHILIWIENPPTEPRQVDRFISAKIPDHATPRLREKVLRYNIHGPCGLINPNSPCMQNPNHVCSRGYAKEFSEFTRFNEDDFPVYARPLDVANHHVRPDGTVINNQWVVPYNPYLTAKYDCHINVEFVGNQAMMKYLYKYVHKGPDAALAELDRDEITEYLNSRYISTQEAVWRLFSFDICVHYPDVMKLNIYLPDSRFAANSELVAYFNYNATAEPDNPCHRMLYVNFPTLFTFKKGDRQWKMRERGQTLGRIPFINPVEGERYYIKLLLNNTPGAKSYEHLRTHRNVIYPTFRQAAEVRELLAEEEQYYLAMMEARNILMPRAMRQLFALILSETDIANYGDLFAHFQDDMMQDYQHQRLENPLQHLLTDLHRLLLQMGKSLYNYPDINVDQVDLDIPAAELEEARNMVTEERFREKVINLRREQREIYDLISNLIVHRSDNLDGLHDGTSLYFLSGSAGVVKTFLYNVIDDFCHLNDYVCVQLSTTGLATNLLNNAQTCHSFFGVPIDITDDSECRIKVEYKNILLAANIIIIDEITQLSKYALQAIDRLLRQLFGEINPRRINMPFGGALILFGGDWKQCLPVVPRGNQAMVLNSTFKASYLWNRVEQLELTEQVRLVHDLEYFNFCEYVGTTADRQIEIPQYVQRVQSLQEMIGFVYGDKLINHRFGLEKIITPLNKDAIDINDTCLNQMLGEERVSVGRNVLQNGNHEINEEALANINSAKLPPTVLRMKVGCPLIITQNINVKAGLCNGTLVKLINYSRNLLIVEILSGKFQGTLHALPRINCIDTKAMFGIELMRIQFPVKLAFAVTINKIMGQTLDKVGLYLKNQCFAHGQLYVGLTRVRRSTDICIYSELPLLQNVVYQAIFQNNLIA